MIKIIFIMLVMINILFIYSAMNISENISRIEENIKYNQDDINE